MIAITLVERMAAHRRRSCRYGSVTVEAVDRTASHLAQLREWDGRVLRRPQKNDGKARAVNDALEQTADEYEYFSSGVFRLPIPHTAGPPADWPNRSRRCVPVGHMLYALNGRSRP